LGTRKRRLYGRPSGEEKLRHYGLKNSFFVSYVFIFKIDIFFFIACIKFTAANICPLKKTFVTSEANFVTSEVLIDNQGDYFAFF
jgi:hypothetical protein